MLDPSNWGKKYAGLTPSEMKRWQTEALEKAMLRDCHPPKVLTPARRQPSCGSCALDLAEGRSTWCRALRVERSTYRYRSRRVRQAQLGERIKEIAATRVCYGYRYSLFAAHGFTLARLP
jgi:hypothetical protein